ncbi:MAG TPA: SDR family NAD(P)-dependent oxidoreductase [Pseudonocardiaceae bacterium]|nr:SDR family NAD(P)-dependent oxidoreductase [Pseudonocardiaceae bacterium]
MSGVAVVTGAGRNLGRAIALALAAAGFDIIVNTRSDRAAAATVADEVTAMGVRAVPVLADVTEPAAVADMMDRAAELGPVRVLVNNAALRTRVPVDVMTFDDWHQVMGVTLDGAFHCVRAALPLLRAAGDGRVINLIGANSLAGDPSRVHVSAAKHGLIGMTLALAKACPDITVNAVSPGTMNPPDEAQARQRRARLAATVAFLASPAAGDVTGQVIEVGPKA